MKFVRFMSGNSDYAEPREARSLWPVGHKSLLDLGCLRPRLSFPGLFEPAFSSAPSLWTVQRFGQCNISLDDPY